MSKKNKGKGKRLRGMDNGNRGVSVGIHNAVLQRLQETQGSLALLQQLLGCYLHAHGEPLFIELVDVPGEWVLVTDEAAPSIAGNRTIKLSLVQRKDLEQETQQIANEDVEDTVEDIVLASERK